MSKERQAVASRICPRQFINENFNNSQEGEAVVLDSVHAASLASPLYGGEFAERVRLSSLLDADGAFVVLRRQKSVTGTE